MKRLINMPVLVMRFATTSSVLFAISPHRIIAKAVLQSRPLKKQSAVKHLMNMPVMGQRAKFVTITNVLFVKRQCN
jgi:hypothetical protein